MKYVYMIVALGLWAYAIVRADTYWKYVPGVGLVIGAVCVVEDYAVPKKAQ